MLTKDTNFQDKYAELTVFFMVGLKGDAVSYNCFLHIVASILRCVVAKKLLASDVEDVVQEILMSIHKARHTYDGVRPIMPWLMSIANFRITDHLRKHYSGMRHQSVDIADYENILSNVTEVTSDNETIDDILDGVPEREKQILTLMHVKGYTAKETGTQLGMKESAVKVAAHRIIKKIRQKMTT